MKTASIYQIKQELAVASPAMLAGLCLRLAKYKKENKELLGYLLFDAHNEQGYINSVKEEMDSQFSGLNKLSPYLAKKSLRKILMVTNRHIRYMASKQAEADLLIHFCKKLKQSGIKLIRGAALANMYMQQIKKIGNALQSLHEDIQHDYKADIEYLKA